MSMRKTSLILVLALAAALPAWAQPRFRAPQDSNAITHLSDIHMRDVCILPDAATQTYYMVGPGWNSVRVYTSKDLKTWQGPRTVFRTPEDIWGDIRVVGIWAPEMHKYKEKYYLFLTFDTRNKFQEQWRGWYPRVTRGSQVLVSDKPTGQWKHQAEPLYEKDGGHGMVFTTFDGKLMNVLHSPNGRGAQPRIFEMEDTGDTLRIVREFTGK